MSLPDPASLVNNVMANFQAMLNAIPNPFNLPLPFTQSVVSPPSPLPNHLQNQIPINQSPSGDIISTV